LRYLMYQQLIPICDKVFQSTAHILISSKYFYTKITHI
jgi:hypothetical protein